LLNENAKIIYIYNMMSYLCDANVSDVLQPTPQNPQNHLKSFKITPQCTRSSLSSMKRTNKGPRGGERHAIGEKGKYGGEKRHLFFLKAIKCLDYLPRSAYLKFLA